MKVHLKSIETTYMTNFLWWLVYSLFISYCLQTRNFPSCTLNNATAAKFRPSMARNFVGRNKSAIYHMMHWSNLDMSYITGKLICNWVQFWSLNFNFFYKIYAYWGEKEFFLICGLPTLDPVTARPQMISCNRDLGTRLG